MNSREERKRDDRVYRQILIERVEQLRWEARMTKLAFHQQLGPNAARDWAKFCTLSDDEAWKHFSLKAINRIMNLFEVGVELLQYHE
jgi:hypothetical protein